MKSHLTESFRKEFNKLSSKIKKLTKEAFSLFVNYPYHPSLQFKHIKSKKDIYSIRINKDYRALGVKKNNDIIWFWIGSHSDYEKLIS